MVTSHSPVICKVTITTLDDRLAAKLEPGAPPPSRRLAAVEQLAKAGIFTGVLLMPVLPFLENWEENTTAIAAAAAGVGAKFVYAAFGVTLRDGQREYFYQKLE
ncbi:MAG: radical SAM protein, partial [Lawsonibacter sp.]|nr:radical SAM protein [Lawsonibacter sp.]